MRIKWLTLSVFLLFHLLSGDGFAASKARIKWRKVRYAGGYLMEIKNQSGRVIFRKITNRTYVDFRLSHGRYEGRISVLNKFKKVSVSSRWFPIVIKKSVIPVFKNITRTRFSPAERNAKAIITGEDFLPGLAVYFRKGRKRYRVKIVNYISKEKISMFVRAKKLASGYYDLVLQNPGGLKAVKRDIIFISKKEATSPFFKPVFKSISNSVFYPNQGKTRVEISGGNFQEGCKIYLQRDGRSIKLAKIEYVSDCLLRVELNTYVLSKGEYDLVLSNPGNVTETIEKKIQVIGVIKTSSSDGKFYDKVRVRWSKGVAVDAYYVYRSKTKGGSYEKIAETGKNNYDDTSIPPGDVFYYKVRPWSKSNGEGPFSTVDSGFRKKQVTGIEFKEYIGKLGVEWKSYQNAVGYELYRSVSKDSGFEKISESYETSFDDITVKTGKKYYYKVKAKTKSGDAVDSMPVAGYTSKTTTGLYLRGIVPGWGQFYLHKDLKGGLFLGAFIASAGFLGWSYNNVAEKKEAYDKLDYGLDKAAYSSKYKEYTRASYIMIGAACLVGAVYIANWLDLLMFNSDDLPPWSKKSSVTYNAPKTQVTFDVKPNLLSDNVSEKNDLLYTLGVSYSY